MLSPAPGPSNAACLACHKANTLEGSVHAAMACRDCHVILPGEGKDIPHAKTLPVVDCTMACHREPNAKQPGMPEKIAKAKIHRESGVQRSGTSYLIFKILLWALIAVAALTLVRFVFELTQKRRRPKTP